MLIKSEPFASWTALQ